MNQSVNGNYRYQVGGALGEDIPSYVTRAADHQFYQALQAQEFCYVLNSRQMGKSSLMVRTLARLKSEGWAGIVLDFSAKDSQVEQAERWYNGIINQLSRHFRLLDNTRTWLKDRDFLSPVERLEEFIETVLLPGINQRIVVFIDEIDSTLNLPFTDDFFALIRACYNKRAENPDYKRLTFALLGVAAPAELISDKKRTPFNIGQAIDLKGFELEEAQPLVDGLVAKAENPQAVLPEILKWTGGQPFLTQRLCQSVVDNSEFISAEKEAESIEKLARTYLIENWESQDEQEHLKTIRNRLLSNEEKAGYLLELYRQIRQAVRLKFQNTSEERELQLSGLVVKRDDHLMLYNPIYEQVFNEQWIDTQLGKLRPYAENFRAWVASGGKDESRLLRGQALEDAKQWSSNKNLSYQDQQFLAASEGKEIQEQIAVQEQEAALKREREDREAAEARNQLLSEVNKKAQQRISIGIVVLVVAVLGAVGLGIFSRQQVDIANSQVQSAKEKVNSANAQVDEAKNQLTEAQKNERKAKNSVTQAKKQEQLAKENEKLAQQKVKQADQVAKKSQQEAQISQEKASKFEQDVARASRTLITAQNNLKAKGAELSKTNNQLNQAKEKESNILAKLKAKENELQQTSTKNDETKLEIANVRQLVALAGQLRNQSSSDSDETLRLAALSFNIDNHQIKQSLLLAAKSQAYQQLKDGNNANNEIQGSQSNLSKADKKFLDSSQGLQVQVLVQKTQGDFLAQNKQTQKAIASYTQAFNIIKAHPNETDFTKDNQLLTGENIESFYRSLRELNPQDKKVELALTKHLYAQLEYYLNPQIKNWEAADSKTYELMLNIAKREKERYLDYEQINNFSCPDLQKIDKLWVNADKRFGFSVQKEIWTKTGNRLGIKPEDWTDKDLENYLQFARAVGWYDDKLERQLSSADQGRLYKRIKEDSVYGIGGLPRSIYFFPDTGPNPSGGVSLLSHCDLQSVTYKPFRSS
ncbi:AAA-like domain-containing protein [Nostoc muscorum FACHB-395]|nr:AAA-like domain-containing protein [Desmonostoc muscorum FACHB-395]